VQSSKFKAASLLMPAEVLMRTFASLRGRFHASIPQIMAAGRSVDKESRLLGAFLDPEQAQSTMPCQTPDGYDRSRPHPRRDRHDARRQMLLGPG